MIKTSTDVAPPTEPGFGRNARALRLRLGLTLDRLAAETGLSKGHLSRFERGEKTLSIAALVRLSQALKTSVSGLLGDPPGDGAFHLVRTGERRSRDVPAADGGYSYAALSSPRDDGALNVFVVDLPADASRSGEAQHGGEEAFLVLAGSVEVELGPRRLALAAGDYLQFSGGVAHRIRALESGTRVFIVVAGG